MAELVQAKLVLDLRQVVAVVALEVLVGIQDQSPYKQQGALEFITPLPEPTFIMQ
jgi:hypothetical protein